MPGIGKFNLKVVVLDTDFYALRAINGYLAWDRRTRVMRLTQNLEELWGYLENIPETEMPDVVLLDAGHLGGQKRLAKTIDRLHRKIKGVKIICLAQFVDPSLVETAAEHHADAYLLKQEVRRQIAWAIVYTVKHDFVITAGVERACRHLFNRRIFRAKVLPGQRQFPEMTERTRQAIELTVVEGMPARLAADEMSVSVHTIRDYIKEGYRILEASDTTDQSAYPPDMNPQELAFVRFTAFEDE